MDTAANREILVRARAVDHGRGDPEWRGTGATAVVALFVPGRALLAHVGDARIYVGELMDAHAARASASQPDAATVVVHGVSER